MLNEWDYINNYLIDLIPENVYINSDKKAWFKCSKCGKSYLISIDTKLSYFALRDKEACPHCKNLIKKKAHFI